MTYPTGPEPLPRRGPADSGPFGSAADHSAGSPSPFGAPGGYPADAVPPPGGYAPNYPPPYDPNAAQTGYPGYPGSGPAYSGGYPIPGYGFAPMVAPRNGLGTAALVLGILGVIFSWAYIFGIVMNVLAIIFGGVGISRAKKGVATNRGTALAGLVLGIVGLALFLILIAVAATLVVGVGTHS